MNAVVTRNRELLRVETVLSLSRECRSWGGEVASSEGGETPAHAILLYPAKSEKSVTFRGVFFMAWFCLP
jgi:hypothetical protein